MAPAVGAGLAEARRLTHLPGEAVGEGARVDVHVPVEGACYQQALRDLEGPMPCTSGNCVSGALIRTVMSMQAVMERHCRPKRQQRPRSRAGGRSVDGVG